MGLYPFNPFAGHKIQGVAGTVPPKRAFIAHYDETPTDAAGASQHAAKLLSATYAKTAAATDFLATAAATDVTLKFTAGGVVVVGDVLQDAAATGELVRVTSIAAAPVYTVERGIAGTTKATHLTGATWNKYGDYVTTELTDPDVPRELTITANESDMNTNVYLVGTDAAGAVLNAAVTMNGSATIASGKAFKTLGAVVFPCQKDADESVQIGKSVKLGLPHLLDAATLLLVKNFDKSTDAGSLAVSATVLASNLYSVAGSMNGSKRVELFYLVN